MSTSNIPTEVLKPLQIFIDRAHQLRRLQKNFAGAFKNPQQKENLRPAIRQAATNADAAQADLIAIFIKYDVQGFLKAYCESLLKDWERARTMLAVYMHNRTPGNLEQLRAAEKALDMRLKEASETIKKLA